MANPSSTPRSEVLSNIQAYAARVASTQHPQPPASDLAAAEARLDQTLADLQARITKERAIRDALRENGVPARRALHRNASAGESSLLHSTDGPSADSTTRLRQTRAVAKAYRQLAVSEPEVPTPNSSLPALLALRTTANDNASVKRSIADTHAELRAAREHLAVERRDQQENKTLQEALQVRVSSLRAAVSAKQDQPAEQHAEEIARKRVEAAEIQRKTSDAEARKCTKALVRFINQRLAPMLAAEELGGPVAGTESGVTEDDVLAGFTAHGRVKKSRPRSAAANDSDAAHAKQQRLRQQRIDSIWGPVRDNSGDFADEENDGVSRSEVEVAAKEMRDLVQELLDVVSQPGGSTAPYIRLARDSAAARFLVRANVAVLHRADARRIRLQDFGRMADD